MDARVDDAAVGAEELEFQIADAAEWIVVIHADFVGELFGIERPAFDVTGKSYRLRINGMLLLERSNPPSS